MSFAKLNFSNKNSVLVWHRVFSIFSKMLRPHGYADEGNSEFVKVRVRKKTDFHFANVDLEFESDENIQPLIDELGDKVLVLYCEEHGENNRLGSLELNPSTRNGLDFYESYADAGDIVGGADVHIEEFCKLIENLSSESRKIWDGCHRKEFDIGFECGNTLKTFTTRIQPKTIKRCAKLGASIMITVYPHFNYEIIHKKDLKKKK